MSKDTVMDLDLASVDHVLTTTRSVRQRLDLDRPVPPELIEEALQIALQAPTGANTQTWRFVIVTDAADKAKIADYYRLGAAAYVEGRTGLSRTGVTMMREYATDDLRQQQREAVIRSGGYLMEQLQRVPVMIVPCIEGRFEHEDVFVQASMWGSILPATWSLMLALRSRRLASAWTTLHLQYEKEVAELLGIPPHYTQAALLPVAWLTGGDLKPAKRLPVEEVTAWGRWGQYRE
ncbi:MAG TPA: nitroreductase family protein [Gammaproteobacteria bacterium]|nr:nitroreductase family protein [Gammaproteobacteria bacterium]